MMNNWYALYVKSRFEFATRGELLTKGIETFLPVAKKLSRWKDRTKLIEFPLFPGYLFIHVPSHPDTFLTILKTRGAIQILSLVPGHPTPINPEEINALRLVIESGSDFDVYPHLKEGDRVRVKKGPLSGAEGTLEVKRDQHMFLVNIELLGRSIGVTICADDIESV